MKIFINARFLTQPITGVQRYAIEISKYLRKLLPDAVFVCPPHVTQHAIAHELSAVRIGRLNSHAWEQIELPLYLRKQKNALLLNLCNTGPLFYSNQVVTIHDLAFLVNPGWFSKSFTALYTFLVPRLAKKSKHIITVSENSKSDICRVLAIPADKVSVIKGSYAPCFSKTAPAERRQGARPYILAVSSLDPRKNFKSLVEAYNSLQLEGIDLLIAGSENKVFADATLKKIIEQNPGTHFSGYVSDPELADLYRNALLFVYPSLYEGFGLPPLEAMACGCPVITSNTSSLPEICGPASHYVDPTQIQDIAGSIRLLIDNQAYRNSLSEKGAEWIKNYSWKNSAEKMAELVSSFTLQPNTRKQSNVKASA
jgi:glycosyltransferase involved in cell wall biosynthesis